MKSHRHRDAKHKGDPAQREPLEIPFPYSVDPGIATPSTSRREAVRGSSPPIAPTHEEPTAALPPEVYLIGCGTVATNAGQPTAQTMGSKAWNLLRMAQMSLPVPPAFVLGTHYCMDPVARKLAASPNLWKVGLHALERATGLGLGDARRPLLLQAVDLIC
jgi:hypothetical protein